MYIAFSLMLILFTTYAEASLGPKSKKALNTNICKLEIQKDRSIEICSASIIGPLQLKTAAHCLHKAKDLNIYCPQDKIFNASLEQVIVHNKYDHNAIHEENQARTYDIAVLDLTRVKQKLFSNYNLLPKNKSETLSIINSSSFCFLAGYGAHEKSNLLGDYNESFVEPNTIEINQQQTLQNNEVGRFLVLPGDSGGSLLCKLNSQTYDIGTISGHDWDFNSYFSPSYIAQTLLPKIDKHPETTNEQLTQENITTSLKILTNTNYKIKPYSKLIINKSVKSTVDLTNVTIHVDKLENEYAFGQITNSSYTKYFICTEDILCEKSAYVKINIKYLSSIKSK